MAYRDFIAYSNHMSDQNEISTNCLTISSQFLVLYSTLNIPTANEEFPMGEIQTWLFLVVAIVLAITVGRLGTVLRERIELRKSKQNKLS